MPDPIDFFLRLQPKGLKLSAKPRLCFGCGKIGPVVGDAEKYCQSCSYIGYSGAQHTMILTQSAIIMWGKEFKNDEANIPGITTFKSQNRIRDSINYLIKHPPTEPFLYFPVKSKTNIARFNAATIRLNHPGSKIIALTCRPLFTGSNYNLPCDRRLVTSIDLNEAKRLMALDPDILSGRATNEKYKLLGLDRKNILTLPEQALLV